MDKMFKKAERLQPFNEDGFTLVELSIAIVIAGILAVIAIPIYSNQITEATKAQVRSDVASTVSSLKRWQDQEGYNKIPAAGAETNEVVIKTDAATTITIMSYNAGDIDNVDFCVEGSKTIGSLAYKYNYSITTSQATENALCVAAPVLPSETYG